MKKSLNLVVLVSALFLSACANTPDQKDPDDDLPVVPEVKVNETTTQKPAAIDLYELERKLNLPRDFDELGYHEKKFNACLLGYRRTNCVPELFVMINFQIVCRDSDGTVEHVSYDLTPYANKELQLKVSGHRNFAVTDAEGYSQMRFISKKSARAERFILNSPPNSMALRAGEITKVVAPADWCK